AAGLLGGYLAETPPERGLAHVRAKYFLAVVNYRRALVPRSDKIGEPHYDEVDPSRKGQFQAARSAFSDLALPENVLAALHLSSSGGQTPADVEYRNSSLQRESHYSP